jgi:cell division protease FtsH
MLTEDKLKITFKDVAGIEEAKDELVEIVDFLKDPEKFHRIGGRIPKGVLLMGSPGTGKTLLAKAIAGEAQVPFFSISGSDFVEMFVGVGASRVRDMFAQAKKSAPCILFIDEIDAVGRHRGAGVGGGNDEREQTLNQLLVEMDGFDENESIIVIAATNRPDVLDTALRRPGRFDRQVVVPLPDIKGREAILKVHMRKVSLADDVEARIIARGTPGFSGADLSNLVNEAALLAARLNKRVVSMSHLEEAKDKVMMGAERRSMVLTDKEKKNTAYHEGGHALVAYYMEDSPPIHKATIIPRGYALGMVMRLPEEDTPTSTLAELNANIAIAMGGRIAEEIIFGKNKVSNGATSDIEGATSTARVMVTKWGFSEKLGPINFGESKEEFSEYTQVEIDKEIRRIVQDGYDVAYKLIKKHIKQLHALAEAMLEFETLSGADIDKIMKGKKLDRDPPAKGKKKAVKKPKSSIPGMVGPSSAPQGA